MSAQRKQRSPTSVSGFTLVEMMVALTISTLVIGMAALIITKPVEAYFDSSERAERTEAAELVIRRLGNDLKRAVPNSVRISTSGTRAIVEMLTYDAVSFYRKAGELPLPGPWSQTDRELDATMADTRFSVFGRLDPTAGASYRYDHFVAINNLGNNSQFDAYRPGNVVMTPNIVRVDVNRDASLEERVTLTPGFRFQSSATANVKQRVFFVAGPVTYICNTAANTQAIRRFDNYAIANGMPTAETNARLVTSGVRNALVTGNVSACRVQCANGVGNARPCLGGLVVEFTVTRPASSGNETTRIFQQFPVDNST